MTHTAIIVFTSKSVREILRAGGSGQWVLNEAHARMQLYLVCTRNEKGAEVEAREQHRSAFLVAPISAIEAIGVGKKQQQRWLIRFERYAEISVPLAWGNWRNPVRYGTLEELGIDPAELTFVELRGTSGSTLKNEVRPLTIAEAKAGLALGLGIHPDSIEIVIRA